MELTEKAKAILRAGSAKARVNRSGIFQQITFRVMTKSSGNVMYAELFTDKQINATDLSNLANEFGLPIEAQNCTAFPKGTSAFDFRIEDTASNSPS